jgi:hypothetical protein
LQIFLFIIESEILKKLQKSFKEIVQVNPQAGYLRLFLAIVFIFGVWSLLAIIFTINHPLAKLNSFLIPNFNSSSLAVSLFRDILYAYLSIFTISTLILIFYIFWLTYTTAVIFYSRLNNFSTLKENRDYLSYCAFSIPGKMKYQFPNTYPISSKNEKTLSFPEGPLIAVVKPIFALFVNNQGIYKSWVNSNASDELEISLEHHDKVIDYFDIQPATINIDLKNPVKNIVFFPFLKINITYAFVLPDTRKIESNYPLINLIRYCDSNNFRLIIEKLIVLELNATVTQLSKDFREPLLQIQPDENHRPVNTRKNKSRELQNLDSFTPRFIKNPKLKTLKRNRKRLLYLTYKHLSHADSVIEDNKTLISVLETMNELFTQNIQNAMKNLFGSEIITAKINAIGE